MFRANLGYRIAHNVATSHVIRRRRIRERLVSIESIESLPGSDRSDSAAIQAEALHHLSMLIDRLKPLDRQIIISYLEGLDAGPIAEITGLSPANIAMKVHRIKNTNALTARQFANHHVSESSSDKWSPPQAV